VNVEARWDNPEQTILYFRIRDGWTWAELDQQLDAVEDLTRYLPYDVSAILDVQENPTLPGGSLFLPDNLQHARSLLQRNQRRHGAVIVVGADESIRMIFGCLRLIDSRIGWQVYFTDTLEEARAYLHQQQEPVQRAC